MEPYRQRLIDEEKKRNKRKLLERQLAQAKTEARKVETRPYAVTRRSYWFGRVKALQEQLERLSK